VHGNAALTPARGRRKNWLWLIAAVIAAILLVVGFIAGPKARAATSPVTVSLTFDDNLTLAQVQQIAADGNEIGGRLHGPHIETL
jgi:hypothetical protein